MYSLVFASDMYATVFKADPLDPVRGDKYRRCILKPGGSREELDSLEVGRVCSLNDRILTAPQEFLGRPPNADAFTKELFGDAAVAGSKSAVSNM
jgi:Peptidase family M3